MGDGTTSDHLTPVQVDGLRDIVVITTGGRHSVALKNNGTVWTWGNNLSGQLGDGTISYSKIPVQVIGLKL